MKLCINTRQELRLIELSDVVYLTAYGNYTDFHFADGRERSELSCISDFERTISRLYADVDSPFVRVGRSMLVNTDYVTAVSIKLQQLTLTRCVPSTISLSKQQARELKQWMVQRHALNISSPQVK